MHQPNPFKISELANPSGKLVYQVYGRIGGQRFRRNFQTRAEAERQVQEIKRLQGDTGLRPAVTRLSEDQLHECEAVIRRLEGQPRSLSFYVDFALVNYHEPVNRKRLDEAVADYQAAKGHELDQDLISPMHLTRIQREMRRLAKHFPKATVAEITSARLRCSPTMPAPPPNALSTTSPRRPCCAAWCSTCSAWGRGMPGYPLDSARPELNSLTPASK